MGGACMSPLLVALCYSSAIAVSLLLLWYFGCSFWLLHAAGVVAAFAIGLIPMSEPWNTPINTLAVGWVFLLLLSWGAGGLILRLIHYDKSFHAHSLHHR